MSVFRAGQIVLADWRDALPREPNKLRPAIVVEDDELFPTDYPNVILVPLSVRGSKHQSLWPWRLMRPRKMVAQFAATLCPTVTTTSVGRLHATPSHITSGQLAEIRRQIALAIGLE